MIKNWFDKIELLLYDIRSDIWSMILSNMFLTGT